MDQFRGGSECACLERSRTYWEKGKSSALANVRIQQRDQVLLIYAVPLPPGLCDDSITQLIFIGYLYDPGNTFPMCPNGPHEGSTYQVTPWPRRGIRPWGMYFAMARDVRWYFCESCMEAVLELVVNRARAARKQALENSELTRTFFFKITTVVIRLALQYIDRRTWQ